MNLSTPPYVILLCLNLEIEASNKNIGRWETTWFNFHILHFIYFNLERYDLYQVWHHCRGPIVWFKVKFSVCLCLCVGVLVCVCVCTSSVVELVYVDCDSVSVCFCVVCVLFVL